MPLRPPFLAPLLRPLALLAVVGEAVAAGVLVAGVLSLACGLAVCPGCSSRADASARPSPASSQAGALAPSYVAAAPCRSLVVEVAYVAGNAPSPEALGILADVLRAHLSKPGGVSATVTPVAAEIPLSDPGIRVRYDYPDIRALERRYRPADSRPRASLADPLQGTASADPSTAHIFAIYLNGALADAPTGLGVAYSADAIAVMAEQVRAVSPFACEPLVEARVLVHEVGHLCGLVGESPGTPEVYPHELGRGSRHCNDPACCMYGAIRTDPAFLLRGPAIDWCGECSRDLRAAGGR